MILRVNDRIRNRKVEFFNNFQLNLQYDSVGSTFSFDFYFDPENPEHRELNCIGHFHECTLEHNGELLITGFIVSHSLRNSAVNQLVKMSGYSKPGALNDCSIPIDVFPLQYENLSLADIAKKMIKPFDLKLKVDVSVKAKANQPYPLVTADPGQSVGQFLANLASQKNIILSHTPKGELLLTESNTSQNPLFDFKRDTPATSFSLTYSGQQMHKTITVVKEADLDVENAGESTIDNPYAPVVFRPKVVKQAYGDDNDTETAARNELGKELKGIKVTVSMSRWDVNDKIIFPNSIVTVENSDIYIYRKQKLFVESVSYRGNSESMTATLTCVVPESYNQAKKINNIFEGWQAH